jgi:hypothetical protein
MLLDPSPRSPVRWRAGPAKEVRTLRWLISRNFLGVSLWTICEPSLFATPVWGLAYQMLCRTISVCDFIAVRDGVSGTEHVVPARASLWCRQRMGRLIEPAILTASRPGGTHLP